MWVFIPVQSSPNLMNLDTCIRCSSTNAYREIIDTPHGGCSRGNMGERYTRRKHQKQKQAFNQSGSSGTHSKRGERNSIVVKGYKCYQKGYIPNPASSISVTE